MNYLPDKLDYRKWDRTQPSFFYQENVRTTTLPSHMSRTDIIEWIKIPMVDRAAFAGTTSTARAVTSAPRSCHVSASRRETLSLQLKPVSSNSGPKRGRP